MRTSTCEDGPKRQTKRISITNLFSTIVGPDELAQQPKELTSEVGHGWQGTKATVCERNAVMLFNELMSDIHFMVGQKGKLKLLRRFLDSVVSSTLKGFVGNMPLLRFPRKPYM